MVQIVKPVYYAFPIHSVPTPVGTFVIGLEKIKEMHDELRVLHAEHYQETETLYLDVPFNPDYARYTLTEEHQQFVLFTVRDDADKLVGYIQYYVFRDMHSSDVRTAREDALFLTKSVRGRNLAPALLKYAEHCLKQLGCRYVGMSSKAPVGGPDIGPFLERAGYRAVATYYVKDMGVADAQATTAAAA